MMIIFAEITESYMRNKLKVFAVTILCQVLFPTLSLSWDCRSLSPEIHTVQVVRNGEWQEPPLLILESDDILEISFDALGHEYRRYTYSIEHCSAEWKKSDLFESDYMEGFNNRPIEDYENSLGATVQYCHYSLSIPNDDLKPRLSGNYLLSIRDDRDGSTVAQVRFMVAEPLAGIQGSVSGNTDIDTNREHQQVSVNVSYGNLRVSDPNREIIVAVSQNSDDRTTAYLYRPTYISGKTLQYEHQDELIFSGGNEFRRFEIINMYDYTQGVDHIDYVAPYFHARLLPDGQAHGYRYDNDHNGRFFIRNHEARDSNTEADYMYVHFSLKSPRLTGGDIYIDGTFCGEKMDNDNMMIYNPGTQCYEGQMLLKQGSYDFRYLWLPTGSIKPETSRIEYDSFETENEYRVLVYYRERGSRYDRLIGQSVIKSQK